MKAYLGTGLRFLGSAVLATVLVLGVMGVLLHYFQKRPQPDEVDVPKELRGIKLLNLKQHPEIEKLIRQQQQNNLLRNIRKPPPPPPPAVTRNVSGFVQLSYTVGADGKVSNVKVIGAVPKGLYEEQAKGIIRARHYQPRIVGGKAIPYTMSDIVHFTVPEKVKSSKGQ